MLKRLILIFFVILFVIPEAINSQPFNAPIVFVSRNHQQNGNIFYPQSGLLPGMGPFSRFTVVGGKLMVRDEQGNIRTLVDSTMTFGTINIIDVQQPCVHWNGEKIVFAGIEGRDSSWRIYEINKAGTRIKKITFTNRNIDLSQFGAAAFRFEKYDDLDPVYLPDGKIVFASTRYPCLSQIGPYNTTNLFIVDTTGANLFRITTEKNGGEKPSIDPENGRIVYSRWWLNIDMPSNLSGTGYTRIDSLALTTDIGNVWQVNTINPDGDMLKIYGSDPRTRKSIFSYRPRVGQGELLLGTYVPFISMTSTSGSPGIRYYHKGFGEAHTVIGVDSTTPLYIHNPPSTGTMMPPYATDPLPLPDGRILFSYANSVIHQDYGIYVCNLNGTGLTPVVDFPGTLELNAEVFGPRPTPPVVFYLPAFDTNQVPPTSDPNTFYQGGLFRFDCVNVFSNAPVDAPIGNAPPIKKNARFKFFVNFQRQNPNGQDNPILFREINLDRSGKIAEGDIPANINLFEQLVDSNGNVVQNREGHVAHVPGMNFGNDGSGTKCVGCHAGHTLITVPPNLTEGAFTNVSTSAEVSESSFRNDHYKGIKVTDRLAHNPDQSVNWVANGSVNEYVVLKWEIPIDVRRFVLYDIIPNANNNTNVHVTDCEMFLYYRGKEVMHIPSTGPLNTQGLTVPVSPITTIDSAKVLVKSFTGLINNISSAGLAEVETNARISIIDLMSVGTPVTTRFDYELKQNYPNPFNPSTLIRFTLAKSQNVKLEVFDVTGRSIATLINGRMDDGVTSIPFHADNLPSGVYFYKLTARDFSATKKMVIVR